MLKVLINNELNHAILELIMRRDNLFENNYMLPSLLGPSFCIGFTAFLCFLNYWIKLVQAILSRRVHINGRYACDSLDAWLCWLCFAVEFLILLVCGLTFWILISEWFVSIERISNACYSDIFVPRLIKVDENLRLWCTKPWASCEAWC